MPLGKRTDYGDSRYAGVEVEFCADVPSSLQVALNGNFDFILAPLVHPDRRPGPPPEKPGLPITPAFTPENVMSLPSQYGTQVVGKISEWIDPDSEDEVIAKQSEVALKQEIGYATHLSIQAILIAPKRLNSANYARILNQALQGLQNMQVWVRIPLVAPVVAAAEGTEEEETLLQELQPGSSKMANDPWEWWDRIRTLCEHHTLLGVCLELGPSLPHHSHLQRWKGEPLRSIVIPTEAFTINKRGYPVLSRRHQDFVSQCIKHNIQLILSERGAKPVAGAVAPPSPPAGQPLANAEFPALGEVQAGVTVTASGSAHKLQHHYEYLAYFFYKMEAVPEQERFELSYRDYLQAPLQPLMDNLENQTYETFEKDDTKYNQYEEAVHLALLDRKNHPTTPSSTAVLMVVGAGRGPLVTASLNAAKRAQCVLKVFALEKNPNALVILQDKMKNLPDWKACVTLVHADMRFWEPEEKADIIVSELLGSFGDNELSPECLDGAQRFLKDNGIMIPCEYTSYLAPITSSKLYNDVKNYQDREHFETAYVVKVHNICTLAPPLSVFTFAHPNKDPVIDNTRYIKLNFTSPADAPASTVHGFVGYFDSKLYKSIHMSTYPPTHTPGMFSWFPIYFPLRTPMHLGVGQNVECHFWRCVSTSKVWYEWSVTSPSVSPTHNTNGRSYWVGL